MNKRQEKKQTEFERIAALYVSQPLQYWMKIDDEAKEMFEALDKKSTGQTLRRLTVMIHTLYLASLCPNSHNEFEGFFGHIKLTYTTPVHLMTHSIVSQKKYDQKFKLAMIDQLIDLARQIGHESGRNEELIL